MKKFVVSSYGGEWEDKWERVVGICPTLEVAKELEQKIIKIHTPKEALITREQWDEMYNDLYEKCPESNFKSFIEDMCRLFPEYSKEDIELAQEIYDSDYDDFSGVLIEEIEFFETISDVTNYNGSIY